MQQNVTEAGTRPKWEKYTSGTNRTENRKRKEWGEGSEWDSTWTRGKGEGRQTN